MIDPTPERIAKGDLILGAQIRAANDPIEWLKSRNKITDTEYAAAMRLWELYYNSSLFSETAAPLVKVRIDRVARVHTMHRQEVTAEYMRVVRHLGAHIGPLTLSVVINATPLLDCGRDLGFKQDGQARAAAHTLLIVGLRTLRDYFGGPECEVVGGLKPWNDFVKQACSR